MTKAIPADPNLAAQWHLTGTWGLHANLIWPDYTGQGILVGILDDGFDYNHADLRLNYRTDLDLDTLGGDDNAIIEGSNKHGTSVAGVIAGDDNGQGGVGVAFDAGLVGIRQGFGAQSNMSQTLQGFDYARTASLDIINNSWGFTNAFSDNKRLEFSGTDIYQVTDSMAALTAHGRGGLGAAIVFAAGNNRTGGDNVNYHNFQNSVHSITVAAIKEDGTFASFSNKGAALLVSAGGTGIHTTDVTGSGGYVSGDFTTFSGTSAAAPIVSGLVALMLEANTSLGWRDVQEILAYSAQKNDPNSAGWQYNDAKNWNGGGLHFSHDYGFGAADAYAAVRLAETWKLQQTSANMVTTQAFNAAPAIAIPDMGTITTTINVTSNIEIEHVLVNLNIDHSKAGDLVVTLIAPDGTQSVLADRINNGNFITDAYGFSGIHFDMTSNAHWGESSQGLWTLKIQDLAGGNIGTLGNWGVQFMGNAQTSDDVYIYTNDFVKLNAAQYEAQKILSDADGGQDTLNLSAMTEQGITVNLNSSGSGSVNFSGANSAKTINIAAGTLIENAYTGDGADILIGNEADNRLYAGRGNDSLEGGAGNDYMDGGAGIDQVIYNAIVTAFNFNFINAAQVNITHLGGMFGMDTVLNVENFIFSGITYTLQQIQNGIHPPPPPPPPPSQDMALKFTQGSKSFLYTSSQAETTILTAKQMGMSTASTQYVRLERNDADLKINYLNSSAPAALLVNASALDDSITISGTRPGLIAEINTGDGNDTVTINAIATSTVRGGNGNDTITGSSGKDTLYGDAGNDTLTGGNEIDMLYGGDGNDALNGDIGNDTLNGDAGDDLLKGGVGNDILNGGTGSDVLNGGDGNDTLSGNEDDDTLNGDAGDDTLNGQAGNDVISGGVGLDKLYGGDGGDTLNGGDNNDTLYGGAGMDTLNGGNHNDMLDGEDGNDTLYGDSGDDTLYGRAGDDILNGGIGVDKLYGGLNNDALNGGDGNDTLDGEDGNDVVNGDAGDDTLYGRAGDDAINGGLGADKLYGGLGNDALNGEDGNDTIYGEDGADTLYGGIGIDSLYGDVGNDTLYGGDGNDILYGLVDNDTLYGDAGDDTLNGEAGNDALNGGNGNDKLVGGTESDTLRGGAGNDTLYGDAGNDLVVGGEGADTLYGGKGNDTFGFTTLGDGLDTVRDFASGDKLNITDILSEFSGDVNELHRFVLIGGGSTKTMSINADGQGNDFVAAFTITGLSGTVESLYNAGILIANQSLA